MFSLAALGRLDLVLLRSRPYPRIHPPALEHGAVDLLAARRARGVLAGPRRRRAPVNRVERSAGARGGAGSGRRRCHVLNYAVKVTVRRPRPSSPGSALTPTVSWLSFPSAHATSSFAAARAYRGLAPPAALYGAAGAFALSRPYLGVHYPSDVLAGAVLGTALGRGVAGDEGRNRRHAQRRQVVAVHGADRRRRRGRQLPVHDDRAQHGDRPVADERLDAVAETVGASKVVPDTIAFHDIAGLVAGAHRGEGLGNQFLANIRETDAIVHVVRAHGTRTSSTPRAASTRWPTSRRSRPSCLRRPRAGRAPPGARRQDGQGGDRHAIAEARGCASWSMRCRRAGRRERPAPADAPDAMALLPPLTAKPVLFVANVDEGSDQVPAAIAAHAEAQGAGAVAVRLGWRPS